MGPFLAFLGLLLGIYLLSGANKPVTIETQCSKENDVTLEQITSASELEFVENLNLRCYEKCLAINHGHVYENGTPILEAYISIFSAVNETSLKSHIVQCYSNNKKMQICDRVYYTSMCIGRYGTI